MEISKKTKINYEKQTYNVKNITYDIIFSKQKIENYFLIFQNGEEIFRASLEKEKQEKLNDIVKETFSEKNDFIDIYEEFCKKNNDIFIENHIKDNFIPKEKVVKQNSPQSNNKKNLNANLNYNQVKNLPVFLIIESLLKNKTLGLVKKEQNGADETFYTLTDNNQNMYKISVLNNESYQLNKNSTKKGYFSDVYNEVNSAGAINLIKLFAERGAINELKGVPTHDHKEMFKASMNYINNSLNLDFDEEHIEFNQIEKSFSSSKTKLPPRAPVKLKDVDHKFIPFFRDIRKIDEDIIKEEVNAGRIWSGILFNPTTNKTYINQTFFKLVNSKGYMDANERIFLKNVNGKPKIEKENLKFAKLSGVSYQISGKSKFKEATIFSEAALDAISTKNIFKYRGYDTDKYNFYSIQGTPHFPNWIKERTGVKINFKSKEKREEENSSLAYFIKTEDKIKDIKLKDIDNFIQSHKYENGIQELKKIIIIDANEKENLKKLYEIFQKSIFSKKIDIEIHSTNNRNVFLNNLDNYEPKHTYIIDKTNFFDFINENSLYIDTENEEIKFRDKEIKEVPVDFTDKEQVETIRKKFRHAIDARDFVMAFDNDYDGLKNIKVLKEFFDKINLTFKAIIPPKLNFENGKETKDNNDILQLIKENKEEKDKILESYFETFENPKILENTINQKIEDSLREKNEKMSQKKEKRLSMNNKNT